MKDGQGHKVYSLFRCQWKTDDIGTEDAQGKRESSPIFAAASWECDLIRQMVSEQN